jgi:DNA-binding transcriptional LysR family regulator
MAWIGPKGFGCAHGEKIPLALFEAPCVFRQPGVEALERAQRSWRLAFTSPSLSGLWAAARAGLGITIRTALGVPSPLAALDKSSGLPKLPQIELSLYAAKANPSQAVARLREILLDELPGMIGDSR